MPVPILNAPELISTLVLISLVSLITNYRLVLCTHPYLAPSPPYFLPQSQYIYLVPYLSSSHIHVTTMSLGFSTQLSLQGSKGINSLPLML